MSVITKVDLDQLARKRRVKSLHKWFATLQRNVNKPAIAAAANAPTYSKI